MSSDSPFVFLLARQGNTNSPLAKRATQKKGPGESVSLCVFFSVCRTKHYCWAPKETSFDSLIEFYATLPDCVPTKFHTKI